MNLLVAPVILQRITRFCGGAFDEKPPNLFKTGPVGSSVPPTSSSFLPQLQKGLIQGTERGTETGEDHYEPINSLFTRPLYSPARGWRQGQRGWEGGR